jgi:hypothetical protein
VLAAGRDGVMIPMRNSGYEEGSTGTVNVYMICNRYLKCAIGPVRRVGQFRGQKWAGPPCVDRGQERPGPAPAAIGNHSFVAAKASPSSSSLRSLGTKQREGQR